MTDDADDDDIADRQMATVPGPHYSGAEFDRRFRELGQRMQQLPPEVNELFYVMRQRLDDMERTSRDFLPRSEIERIADNRARATLEALGFDMKHVRETAAQVSWLLSLRRSVRGFLTLLGASIVTLGFTLLGTFITSRWSK